MTTRERIVLALMGATVLWGGYAVSRSLWLRQAPERRADASQTSDLRDFAAAARLSVTATRPRPDEYAVLNKAMEPWTNSPFAVWVPAPVVKPEARIAAPREPVFRFTGFVRVGEVRFAILNGREHRVGDAVSPGDFVVQSIEPDRVVLAAKGGGRQLTVALERTEQKKGEP